MKIASGLCRNECGKKRAASIVVQAEETTDRLFSPQKVSVVVDTRVCCRCLETRRSFTRPSDRPCEVCVCWPCVGSFCFVVRLLCVGCFVFGPVHCRKEHAVRRGRSIQAGCSSTISHLLSSLSAHCPTVCLPSFFVCCCQSIALRLRRLLGAMSALVSNFPPLHACICCFRKERRPPLGLTWPAERFLLEMYLSRRCGWCVCTAVVCCCVFLHVTVIIDVVRGEKVT